jgi:hypothetical protein
VAGDGQNFRFRQIQKNRFQIQTRRAGGRESENNKSAAIRAGEIKRRFVRIVQDKSGFYFILINHIQSRLISLAFSLHGHTYILSAFALKLAFTTSFKEGQNNE